MEDSSIPNITNLKDERVFENIFRLYYKQLVAFAHKYVSDSQLAEKLVQEMFTNLWHKAYNIEIRTSIKSHLYGSARNACLNYIKHKNVEKKY
ncbi:MAG: hypothetical protein NWS46_06755 [Cyclobacteriaceae bacterium]|nr:hypothetical protein [Cyclobacteriaceae bacterium]